MHTNWTDGNNSIVEMAQAAKTLGLEYIAITDHSRTLGIARGLTKERLAEQEKEIEKINQTISNSDSKSKIRILR
jgi:DNA polymerase (family 10)